MKNLINISIIISILGTAGIVWIFTSNLYIILGVTFGVQLVNIIGLWIELTWFRKRVYNDTFRTNRDLLKYLYNLYT